MQNTFGNTGQELEAITISAFSYNSIEYDLAQRVMLCLHNFKNTMALLIVPFQSKLICNANKG